VFDYCADASELKRARRWFVILDVIIATHNRCSLLRGALASLLRVPVPQGLEVTINVVDNNSSDDTARVVTDVASDAALPVRYLLEPRKGQAFAINTGVESTQSDLVGLIDDDEEVDSSWFFRISEAFQDSSLDFIGGPYIPLWGAPKPEWLPRQAKGIIGWQELSTVPKRYGEELPGAALCGGNAVIRRSVLKKAGPFRTDLNGHHDLEMFERLLSSGARGIYLPDLIIYHHIPPDRLRKEYFRQWMWKAGVAYARMPEKTTMKKVFGVPRYVLKRALQSLVRTAISSICPNFACSRFESELDLIYSISFAHTRFRLRNARPV
jgi:glycosyltransferase involved in cell wall biosynthesis